jgi:signal transduction histidine kinase
LQTIIDDVLDFSKIESHTLTLHCERFQPAELCRPSSSRLQAQASARASPALASGRDAPRTPCRGSVRLSQVISNLLGNAVKFTSQGSVRLALTWEEAAVGVMVSDTGIGISTEDQALLFEPFLSGRQFGNPPLLRLGAGWPSARRLVQLMGGDICVQSTPGLEAASGSSCRDGLSLCSGRRPRR